MRPTVAGAAGVADGRLPLLAAVFLAVAVFAIDAFTPLDIAIAVLYVIVVLLVAATGSRHATLLAGGICALLTVVGYALSGDLHPSPGQAERFAISLLALSTTTVLALRHLATTARLREQVEMLDLTHDAIVVHDMNGIVTFWNRGAEELYGWSAAEAVGQSFHGLTQTRFPAPEADIRADLLAAGRWAGELSRTRRDGSDIVISSRLALWRDRTGKPVAVLATNNDITERQKAKAALAQSEAFLAEAQRLSKTGSIAIRLPDGSMTWSEEAYRILGYAQDVSPDAARVLAHTHPEDLESALAVRERMCAGQPHVCASQRLLLPDGTVKHVKLVARLTAAEPGRTEYVGALMDVTEAVQTQRALQRSQAELAHVTRITTLGELAASIAHEVTQPIAAIVTCGGSALRWLDRPSPDLAEARQSIGQMIRDAGRAGEIVRRIRAMARKHDASFGPVDLNGLVEEAVELVRRELQDQRIETVLDLGIPAPIVHGDRVQLQQVLLNLLVNAVQAMSGVDGRRRRIWLATAADAHNARLTVRDAGNGFRAEDAEDLFNAFYTTKPDGVGMGLSICRSIAEGHGGAIRAEAPPEGGAIFQLTLPLQDNDHP